MQFVHENMAEENLKNLKTRPKRKSFKKNINHIE